MTLTPGSSPWPVRDHGRHRCRWHGRGLSRPRHPPQPRRRHQSASGVGGRRSGSAPTIHDRSAGRRSPESSERPDDLRSRHARRASLSRNRVAQGHTLRYAPRRRDGPRLQGRGLRAADGVGPCRGSRPGHCAPRHQAREPLRHHGRVGQDPRLRLFAGTGCPRPIDRARTSSVCVDSRDVAGTPPLGARASKR